LTRRLAIALACCWLFASLAAPAARAWVLAEDELEGSSTELGLVLRGFGFFFYGETLEPPLSASDENPAASSVIDARLTFVRKTERYAFVVHGQLTSRFSSSPLTGTAGLGRVAPPSRWLPLSFDVVDENKLRLRLALDWVYGRISLGPLTITAGRQPVTFGRGRFWHPLDLVGMFSLTEVDTEYKPGVDALRVAWQLAPRRQLTLLIALGELKNDQDIEANLRGSSLLLRFKQGFARGELGYSAGFVRRDGIVALDAFYDIKVADLYGELVLHFPTRRSLTPAPSDAVVPSAVLGTQIKPHSKITVNAELFYNGFGTFTRQRYLQRALGERASIGELTGLGRLYLGAAVLWELHPLIKLTLAALQNLRDPSALVSLSASYNVLSNVELLVGVYGPLGAGLDQLTVKSEFGIYPLFAFAEIKIVL
jgi:hypothetical protein